MFLGFLEFVVLKHNKLDELNKLDKLDKLKLPPYRKKCKDIFGLRAYDEQNALIF